MPHKRRLVLVLMVLASSCGADTAASTSPDASTMSEAAFTCEGLADRWADLQQGYLDRLSDATAAELDAPTPEAVAAGRWLGNALIEQARDQRAVGCDDLVAGATPFCERLDGLVPTGEAGRLVVVDLRSNCSAAD